MKNAARMVINKLPQLKGAISKLAKRDVLVGVPQADTERKDPGAMTNATLAYIHDNGSPGSNIPARPFMHPGILAAKPGITGQFKAAARGALEGKDIEPSLNKAGLVAQTSIKGIINAGIEPALADSTLRGRIRNRTSIKGAEAELAHRAGGGEAGMDLAKPLVATGQLRNSITYVVRGT